MMDYNLSLESHVYSFLLVLLCNVEIDWCGTVTVNNRKWKKTVKSGTNAMILIVSNLFQSSKNKLKKDVLINVSQLHQCDETIRNSLGKLYFNINHIDLFLFSLLTYQHILVMCLWKKHFMLNRSLELYSNGWQIIIENIVCLCKKVSLMSNTE